jgi:hypothetical protein
VNSKAWTRELSSRQPKPDSVFDRRFDGWEFPPERLLEGANRLPEEISLVLQVLKLG